MPRNSAWVYQGRGVGYASASEWASSANDYGSFLPQVQVQSRVVRNRADDHGGSEHEQENARVRFASRQQATRSPSLPALAPQPAAGQLRSEASLEPPPTRSPSLPALVPQPSAGQPRSGAYMEPIISPVKEQDQGTIGALLAQQQELLTIQQQMRQQLQMLQQQVQRHELLLVRGSHVQAAAPVQQIVSAPPHYVASFNYVA
eukprot:TRINITY_DN40924_c0_g1_i1.p1 TRINITY_DN40924_c0_g1~~TRINITY_DN40924_c0_g1_i1.p1  ORF type:complete len:203 (+),score=46.50 TRINITY_DN40924_c0_g1_i1:122-730(+)